MANSKNIEFKFNFVGDFSDIAGDVNQIQKMLNKLKLPTDQKLSFSNIFDDLAKEQAKYQKYLDSGFKKKGDVTGLEASGERLDKLFKKLNSELAKISLDTLQNSFQIDTSDLDELNRKLQETRDKLAQEINSEGLSNIKKQALEAAAEISKLSKTKFTGEFLEAFNMAMQMYSI